MKVRAVANGNILDESDVPASLIDAGIYERIDDTEPKNKPKPAPEPLPPAAESTKVKPMTTKDIKPDAPNVFRRPQGKKRA